MATKYHIQFTKNDWGRQIFSIQEVSHRLELWRNWLRYLIDNKVVFEGERLEFDMVQMRIQSEITLVVSSFFELESAISTCPVVIKLPNFLSACA